MVKYMKDAKQKLIIFDVDGTIRDNHKGCIYPSTIYTLRTLKENGHVLAIASGRNYAMLESINALKPYIDAYILINGMQILYQGKEIYRNVLDKHDIENLLKDFDNEDIAMSYVSSTNNKISKITNEVRRIYNDFNISPPEIDRDYYLKDDIYQIWCFGEKDKIAKFASKHLKFAFLPWGDGSYGYDVIKAGCNKASTLNILIKELGFDIKDVISIGDGNNDSELLKISGIGIAMGNASVKAKESSDYITDDIENDGLYKAFVHFDMIDKK